MQQTSNESFNSASAFFFTADIHIEIFKWQLLHQEIPWTAGKTMSSLTNTSQYIAGSDS